MTTNSDHHSRLGLRLLMLGALLPVLCGAGTATASVTASREIATASAPANSTANASEGTFEVAGWSKKGNTNSAFKPDPIYGGGRGRDPYGAPLETDPYRAGGNPNNIKFAPPNAGLHGNMGGRPKKGGSKEEAEAPPPERRRMNPDDKSADNRANRAAARASEEEGRE